MDYIRICENGIHIVFGITKDQKIKLLHFSAAEFDENNLCKPKKGWRPEETARREQLIQEAFQLVQVNLSGYDRPYEKQGNKYVATAPGYLYHYVGMEDTVNQLGRRLVIVQEDREVSRTRVETVMQFYTGTKIVRFVNKIINLGTETQTLEYISSFSYTGIEKEGEKTSDEKMRIRIPYNSWQKELSWQEFTFDELGFAQTQPGICQRTSQVLEITNTGHWSTKKYLPMGYIENRDAHTSLYWQIEHNGSWHYEMSDVNNHFYVSVSGPAELQSHWYKELKPGESFETVPVAVGVEADDFDAAMGELTKYRRIIRRPNKDDNDLPVIFNDYMNCLFGNPTTENEIPLIDAAAECGCEYYVIDAGWYAPGEWWDGVGEWKECRERFPQGIRKLTDYIREKGMIPGVWLELEVMGVRCKIAEKAPDDWFFMRHGKRVYDRSRYQLDFRNPQVRAYADEVIDRVVNEYGVGYIKMDYNIEPGIGTESGADSPGQGLLEHERAYLSWLDDIFRRYPDLVIENCSSGGLRMDYAMLSRYSIQSMSDQEDYRNFATIAANAATGAAPEQAAIWSYPMRNGDKEETIYNMVNAMLLRIHQSGHLAELSRERKDIVIEGINCYKKIREDIRKGLPFWPLGLAGNLDTWLAAGIKTEKRTYLAVWKRDRDIYAVSDADKKNINVDSAEKQNTEIEDKEIPLGKCLELNDGEQITVKCIFPEKEETQFAVNTERNSLVVRFEQPVMARLFQIDKE